MEPEDDNGNIEYKWKLTEVSMLKVDNLMGQMGTRLRNGRGTCFYQVGVMDNGQVLGITDEECLETLIVLYHVSQRLDAEMSMVKMRIGMEGSSFMLRVTSEIESPGAADWFADLEDQAKQIQRLRGAESFALAQISEGQGSSKGQFEGEEVKLEDIFE